MVHRLAHHDRGAEQQPKTALLDYFTVAPDSVGVRTPKQLYEAGLATWRRDHIPVVIAVLGELTAGKTTLCSELTALAAYHLGTTVTTVDDRPTSATNTSSPAPPVPSVPHAPVAHIAYERVQDASHDLGLVPHSHGFGKRTAEDYARFNALAVSVLAQAIGDGGFIILEVVGFVFRGDTVIEDLARHRGAFAHLSYQLFCVWLTPDAALLARGALTRARFAAHPDDKVAALADAHVAVELGPLGQTGISGGTTPALQSYYEHVAPYLFALLQSGVGSPEFDACVREPNSFLDGEMRTRYIRQCLAPHVLLTRCGLPAYDVVVCENHAVAGVILHQAALDAHDFIGRLQMTGRLQSPYR